MQPVEVDVVGLQAAQRLLELGDERLAAGAAAVGVSGMEVAEELGAEHDTLAQPGPRGEEAAEDLLGVPVGVDVRGVDDVAAAVEIPGENRLGGLGVSAPAPVLRVLSFYLPRAGGSCDPIRNIL